jgi:hypothetical protein
MAAFGCGRRAGEILIEVRITGTGDVTAVVRRATGGWILELEPAVDDDHAGSGELCTQRGCVDEWIHDRGERRGRRDVVDAAGRERASCY